MEILTIESVELDKSFCGHMWMCVQISELCLLSNQTIQSKKSVVHRV